MQPMIYINTKYYIPPVYISSTNHLVGCLLHEQQQMVVGVLGVGIHSSQGQCHLSRLLNLSIFVLGGPELGIIWVMPIFTVSYNATTGGQRCEMTPTIGIRAA